MSTATELLRRADEICSRVWDPKAEELSEDIRAYLAAEEQYDALSEHYVEGLGNSMKACKESFEREAERVKELLTAEPEAEPVGWLASYPENPDLGNWFCHTNFADYEGVKCEPLYLHPPRPEPARKPMTEREIMEQAKVDGFNAIDTAVFAIGVRWAERMHGIGGDDD